MLWESGLYVIIILWSSGFDKLAFEPLDSYSVCTNWEFIIDYNFMAILFFSRKFGSFDCFYLFSIPDSKFIILFCIYICGVESIFRLRSFWSGPPFLEFSMVEASGKIGAANNWVFYALDEVEELWMVLFWFEYRLSVRVMWPYFCNVLNWTSCEPLIVSSVFIFLDLFLCYFLMALICFAVISWTKFSYCCFWLILRICSPVISWYDWYRWLVLVSLVFSILAEYMESWSYMKLDGFAFKEFPLLLLAVHVAMVKLYLFRWPTIFGKTDKFYLIFVFS